VISVGVARAVIGVISGVSRESVDIVPEDLFGPYRQHSQGKQGFGDRLVFAAAYKAPATTNLILLTLRNSLLVNLLL